MNEKAGILDLFSRMLLIRRFEEALIDLYARRDFSGHFHVCIGQEASAAVAMSLLGAGDHITTTHRNHGHILARGVDEKAALAEILGRSSGLNSGYAGSFHLTSPDLGFLSTSGIVGGSISLGVGGAFACKQRGDGSVTMALFGDGALEEGVAFESLSLAALWKLPVVFICENNDAELWSEAGTLSKEHAVRSLCDLPRLCGIRTISIDGVEVDQLARELGDAIAYGRSGAGPVFVEVRTARWPGNRTQWPNPVTGRTDIAMAFSPALIPDAERQWFERHDPVLALARKLAAAGEGDSVRSIDAAIDARMNAAIQFALNAPYPKPQAALNKVFA
jgi:TPP-dependent pyruvate/acetoin dehydrogenase alpha subunit